MSETLLLQRNKSCHFQLKFENWSLLSWHFKDAYCLAVLRHRDYLFLTAASDLPTWPQTCFIFPRQWFHLGSQCFSNSERLQLPTSLCVCVCVFMSDSLWPLGWGSPGSSVHGILQAKILDWVDISFPSGSSQPEVQIHVSLSPALDVKKKINLKTNKQTWVVTEGRDLHIKESQI